MNVGDKYTHPELGIGVVVRRAVMQGKAGYRVNFGYVEKFIPEVNDVHNNSNESVAKSSADGSISNKHRNVLSKAATDARKGISALRLGQILESHVHQLSVGTEGAEKILREALDKAASGKPTMVMVDGVWGGGKTHLLTLLTALAREKEFVTSGVVMDGVGITLTDPMLLMESITSTIRFPDESMPNGLSSRLVKVNPTTLRLHGANLLADAIQAVPKEALLDAEVLHILEDYFGLSLTATMAKDRLRWLGHRVQLPALKARSIADRAARFCDLIRNWAQFTVTLGSRGLVIILDEIDVEYSATAWSNRASFAKSDRRKWLLGELGNMRKSNVPILIAFASAPASNDVSERNDAVKGVHSSIGGLDYHIKVPSPSESNIRELGRKVVNLYMQAYPESANSISEHRQEELLSNIVHEYQQKINPIPRVFVRSVLEYMDVESAS